MDFSNILVGIFSVLSVVGSVYFLKIRKLIAETLQFIAALDDVLTDTAGETEAEKIADIKKLRTEGAEVIQALKAMFQKS